MNNRVKLNYAIAGIAIILTLIIVSSIIILLKEISYAHDFCAEHNMSHTFNLSGHYCGGKMIIKQSDGKFLFVPNFSFNISEKWG